MRRRRGGLSKNRRGFTLILTALMLTVLIGSAAFAVDFGRMYMYRAQLQSAADAAALAAAERVMAADTTSGHPANAATTYSGYYLIEGNAVALASITPGKWSSPNTFVTSGVDWSNANAARASVVLDSAKFTFGRVFGWRSRALHASADAVVGSVGETACIRPTALPYASLLRQIYGYRYATTGDSMPSDGINHVLTSDDVDSLRKATAAKAIQLRITDNGGSPTPGNYYGIKLGPVWTDGASASTVTNGFSTYDSDFGGPCSGTSYHGTVGPGDWLQSENGVGSGKVQSGFEILCSPTKAKNNATTACGSFQEIKVAIWSPPPTGVTTPAGCSGCDFYVRYVGVFVVTSYNKTGGDPKTNPDGIWGYFSSMSTSGSFTGVPSPLKRLGLVR